VGEKSKKPTKIKVVFVEPIPVDHLEDLKEIVKKAALRRLAGLQEENAVAHNPIPSPTEVKKPQQHVIHKAIQWKKLIENGTFKSRSEIARKEGLTKARVTLISLPIRLTINVQWR
jgi:hypothetical protein